MKHIISIMKQIGCQDIKKVLMVYLLVIAAMLWAIGFRSLIGYDHMLILACGSIGVLVLEFIRIYRQTSENTTRILMLPNHRKSYFWSEVIYISMVLLGVLLVVYATWMIATPLLHSLNPASFAKYCRYHPLFSIMRLVTLGKLLLLILFIFSMGLQCTVFILGFCMRDGGFHLSMIKIGMWFSIVVSMLTYQADFPYYMIYMMMVLLLFVDIVNIMDGYELLHIRMRKTRVR